MIHGASRQKTRRGSFWPFILALCEGAIPSICREVNFNIKHEKDGGTYRHRTRHHRCDRQAVQS
jgi:hypothetical protein